MFPMAALILPPAPARTRQNALLTRSVIHGLIHFTGVSNATERLRVTKE